MGNGAWSNETEMLGVLGVSVPSWECGGAKSAGELLPRCLCTPPTRRFQNLGDELRIEYSNLRLYYAT